MRTARDLAASLAILGAAALLAPGDAEARRGGGRGHHSHRSQSGHAAVKSGARKPGTSTKRDFKGAHAIDGDTFKYGGKRYRLRSTNAPELGQPGAAAAKRKLQRELDTGKRFKPIAKDKYGRTLVEEK